MNREKKKQKTKSNFLAARFFLFAMHRLADEFTLSLNGKMCPSFSRALCQSINISINLNVNKLESYPTKKMYNCKNFRNLHISRKI